MLAACELHIEQAIDEFVDRYELSPDLSLLDASAATTPEMPARCHFCTRTPLYLLT